jgi:hypothetical protein
MPQDTLARTLPHTQSAAHEHSPLDEQHTAWCSFNKWSSDTVDKVAQALVKCTSKDAAAAGSEAKARIYWSSACMHGPAVTSSGKLKPAQLDLRARCMYACQCCSSANTLRSAATAHCGIQARLGVVFVDCRWPATPPELGTRSKCSEPSVYASSMP